MSLYTIHNFDKGLIGGQLKRFDVWAENHPWGEKYICATAFLGYIRNLAIR